MKTLKPIFKKETLRVYNDFNKKALGNYAPHVYLHGELLDKMYGLGYTVSRDTVKIDLKETRKIPFGIYKALVEDKLEAYAFIWKPFANTEYSGGLIVLKTDKASMLYAYKCYKENTAIF